MRLVVLLVTWLACGAGQEALFGSAGVLRTFLQESGLAEHHVGVGFDVMRGTPSNVRLFGPAPPVDVDVLAAKARYTIQKLAHPRDAHELGVREMHTEYVTGMLTRWHGSPVAFVPPQPSGAACFVGTRSEVLLEVRLKVEAKSRLDVALTAALVTLPDVYNAEDTAQWTTFFSVFPMYYAESALVGGKIVVSALALEVGDDAVKTAIDRALHSGVPLNASMRVNVRDRVTVYGGDASLLQGTIRYFAEDKHAQWEETVKRSPTVIGHKVRPISDLVVGNARKKMALQFAIEGHLSRSYEHWRTEQVRHNRDVQTLQSAKEVAQDNVNKLEEKRRDVQRRLQEQQAVIKQCDEQDERNLVSTIRCRDEIKAFQSALIKCDTRNENLAHVSDALFACEAKKALIGCRARNQPAQESS